MENTSDKIIELGVLMTKLTEEVKVLGGKLDTMKDGTILNIHNTINDIKTDIAIITERTKDLDDKFFDRGSGRRLEWMVYGTAGVVGTQIIVWVLSLIKH